MGKEQGRRLCLKSQEFLERIAKIGTDTYFENYSHAKKKKSSSDRWCYVLRIW